MWKEYLNILNSVKVKVKGASLKLLATLDISRRSKQKYIVSQNLHTKDQDHTKDLYAANGKISQKNLVYGILLLNLI